MFDTFVALLTNFDFKNNILNKNIKIGFLTATDPNDRRSWSGTHYFLIKTIRSEFPNTISMGPINGGYLLFFGRIKSKIYKILFGKQFDYHHSKKVAKHYAIQVKKKLIHHKIDLIFSATSSSLIAYLDTTIPIISLSDSTVARMINYYKGYTNLTPSSIKQANEIEQKNIEKTNKIKTNLHH